MAKKKKKKAVNKKNVSSKKKKTNSTKNKTTTSKNSRNLSNKSGPKKVSNTSSTKKNSNVSSSKKAPAKKNVNDTKVSTKKKTKFNKKILIISFVLLILGVVGVIFVNSNINNRVSNDSFTEISFDEYLDLYEKEGLQFVYLYNNSCINCDSYEEKLINLEKEFEIDIKKFDYSKLNNNDISILKSSNSFLEDDIEIPMIISIKDGNEISSVSGIKEYSALKNFVNISTNEHGVNKFNKIDVDDYLSILSSKEKSIIYICDSSESCNKFSTTLDSVSSSRKVKINYLNTENIVSSEDWDNLEESNKIFKDMWFMPAVLVVKEGNVVDYKMETLSEKELNKFLKKNGL